MGEDDGPSASGVNSPSSSRYTTQQTSTMSSEGPRRRPPVSTSQPSGYGSITSPLDRRNPNPNFNTTSSDQPKPKKPAMSRRTTSAKFPHKGQEFSVDDAEDEVNEELSEQQKQKPQKTSPSSSQTLRRKPSTVRRRTAAQIPALPTVSSAEDDDAVEQERAGAPTDGEGEPSSSGGETLRPDEDTSSGNGIDEDDDGEVSDAESFTLKDRQEAINVTHPFGIRIWKPALYKKSRSVQRNAEGDIHSTPGLYVHNWLWLFNIAWTLIFGWWLALVTVAGGVFCALFWFSEDSAEYAQLLFHLAGYLFFPFGKYVKLMQDEAYADEDEGEGRSISEYERWQSGDIEEGRLFFGPPDNHGSIVGQRRNSVDSTDETTSLLGRDGRANLTHADTGRTKRRLFGRGKWNFGRVVFFVYFYGIFTPALLFVCGLCWFMVFTIPMGKVTILLFDHLRRHPLALSFHSSGSVRRPGESSSVLLCTYRAVGIKYWKYTIDGTNIFLFNLLGLVAFVIFDFFVLREWAGIDNALTNQFMIFTLALFSIIPLAYFIGQAVASISAQSSMGVGATINAFFSTVVEVYLYCIALNEEKAPLVEGSIIGSIFAGILFLPGLSMCFGALKRKTQRFNVKSAGVTSTMLLFAVIGAFGPTLFYQIYGSHELKCTQCVHGHAGPRERDCRRCSYSQTPTTNDPFFRDAVQPYIWLCAALLLLSYLIGLLFTLRTHAAVIWSTETDEKKPLDLSTSQVSQNASFEFPSTLTRQGTSHSVVRGDVRNSQLYKRIVGQALHQVAHGSATESAEQTRPTSRSDGKTPHVVPPKDGEDQAAPPEFHLAGLSERDNESLVRHITEIAAATTAIATRDAIRAPRKTTQLASLPKGHGERHHHRSGTVDGHDEPVAGHEGGGHDAPNWSRAKSSAILLTATIAYAVIAEILVNTVDAVLEGSDIDQKFLGITLFALVPNTTEFLNAISFAMNGNIALSMEIGSAYALQVLLLQIPALVFYSAIRNLYSGNAQNAMQTFTLIFPQWDMVTVILCVLLLSYMYGEGKSNYFKGSILILSYMVVITGFHFASFSDFERMEIDPMDTLAIGGLMEQRYGAMGKGPASG